MTLLDIRNAPYSAKTACWVPDKEFGYIKGEKLGEKDGKIEVKRIDDKVKLYKPEQVEQQNPPKYELLEDMANMTNLSEATVIHNLKSRYERFLIYTYSGKYFKFNNSTILNSTLNLNKLFRPVLRYSQSIQVATCLRSSRGRMLR